MMLWHPRWNPLPSRNHHSYEHKCRIAYFLLIPRKVQTASSADTDSLPITAIDMALNKQVHKQS